VEALERLRARGATVIAVTQRRRLLSVVDRVIVLRDGAIERSAVRREAATNAPPEVADISEVQA
jgi:ABC-type protease/lipase transport system fused ATPase/permease subunit